MNGMVTRKIIASDLGRHISEYFEKMIAERVVCSIIYNNNDFIVNGEFNGVTFLVDKHSTPESLMTHFNKQLEISRK